MRWPRSRVCSSLAGGSSSTRSPATALARPSYRALFDHPSEDRFTAGEFLAELPRHGLDIADRWRIHIGGDYLLGVATKSTPARGER